MDQRTAAIDQDIKDIVQTRLDIAEKLELLEQRIMDTAEGATMKFSRLLDEGSQSVTQMVDKTKAALDPVHKVDDYPWLMVGGAICAGYVIGLLEARTRAQRSGVYAYYPPGAHASRVMPESDNQAKRLRAVPKASTTTTPTHPRRHAGLNHATAQVSGKRSAANWDRIRSKPKQP